MKNYVRATGGGTIQEFIHCCQLAKIDGITEIDELERRLMDRHREIMLEHKREFAKYKSRNQPMAVEQNTQQVKCTSCGKANMKRSKWYPDTLWCPKCHYSRQVG